MEKKKLSLGEEFQADFKFDLQQLLNRYNAHLYESCGVIEARFEGELEVPNLDITEMRGDKWNQ